MIDRRTLLEWLTLGLGLYGRMPEPEPEHEHEDDPVPVPSLGDPDRIVSVPMKASAAYGLHRALATGTPMTGPDVALLLVTLNAEIFL